MDTPRPLRPAKSCPPHTVANSKYPWYLTPYNLYELGMKSSEKRKVGPDNTDGGGIRKDKDIDLPPMPKRPSLVSIDSEDENKMVEVRTGRIFFYACGH